MPIKDDPDRWARFRFSIIGPLFSAPPSKGSLRKALEALTEKNWTHPVNGTTIRFSFATIERWYYAARKTNDPVAALRRLPREDAGRFRKIITPLIEALKAQYRTYPGWTVQLHYDNLLALSEKEEAINPLPSYGTVRRYMRANGLHRKRRPKRDTPGGRLAEARLEKLEVRSYEADYTHGLWHADFHHGSLPVLMPSGNWVKPLLLCFIDDHSRLVWTDNGAAMKAEEFTSGVHTLGIQHETTLPYSPYQNAKQEVLWATIEGRLMAMLAGVKELTLERLNELTQVVVISMPSMSDVFVRTAPHYDKPSAVRSLVASVAATAPSAWQGCALRSPGVIVTWRTPHFAMPAGICVVSTSLIRAP